MTTEREQTRRARSASEDRAAIFWAVVIFGTVLAIELGVLIWAVWA